MKAWRVVAESDFTEAIPAGRAASKERADLWPLWARVSFAVFAALASWGALVGGAWLCFQIFR